MAKVTATDRAAWAATAEAALAEIAAWREGHSTASFDEIEAAVTERLRPLRARVLTDAMQAGAQAAFAPGDGPRPRCPACGERLRAKGRKRRTVRTLQGEAITLERTEARCPACGAGFFPPGS
jgi:YgiT-type zinc finger domain-containing protein